jgi:predicted DNA-binding protein (MmcQ/YjbR family)
MPKSQLKSLRKACLALPDAHEVEAWGAPTFRVNNKLFAMYAEASNHHGAGHEAVWVKCTPINQSLMIGANPKRFFFPPYVGPSGWIGVRLDVRVNWKELSGILRDGYDMTVAGMKRPARPRANRRIRSAGQPAKAKPKGR